MGVAAAIQCAIPSCLSVGEEFRIRVKVLGRETIEIPAGGQWNHWKPQLVSCFNKNARDIRFMDNCLPEWTGRLIVGDDPSLDGQADIVFDGRAQGVFRGDTRPIKSVSGFFWRTPGFHFLQLTEPESGSSVMSNPVYVSEKEPALRIFWGDPHWQTFFSDGLRCPEELYAFARDEGFLDFGAITDHMEAVTDRQWQYFQSVTDDYNKPHEFVTLHGQEWTHHLPEGGAPGHRNVYFRRAGGPALRCTDSDCNTLEKLWAVLRRHRDMDPLAIPHHTANTMLGVDWEQGWNPEFEKAVEIYSVWGSSETSAERGNPRPILSMGGERAGCHVLDALDKGYRFGFVGGGDIHDGRPGDDLHSASYPAGDFHQYHQGFTAALAPGLTREYIYDAIKKRQTYAATRRGIYVDIEHEGETIMIRCASEEGLKHVQCIADGEEAGKLLPETDPRIVQAQVHSDDIGPYDYLYFRVVTKKGNMAWSSPTYRE